MLPSLNEHHSKVWNFFKANEVEKAMQLMSFKHLFNFPFIQR